MRNNLRLTVWIVLFAFIALPLVSFAHYGDGSFHAVHCTTCGEAAHMNPNDCKDHDGPEPVYQHASDCPCDDCVAKRETSGGWLSTAWDRYIRPTLEEIPGAATTLNIIEDAFTYDGSYPIWGVTGGHGH